MTLIMMFKVYFYGFYVELAVEVISGPKRLDLSILTRSDGAAGWGAFRESGPAAVSRELSFFFFSFFSFSIPISISFLLFTSIPIFHPYSLFFPILPYFPYFPPFPLCYRFFLFLFHFLFISRFFLRYTFLSSSSHFFPSLLFPFHFHIFTSFSSFPFSFCLYFHLFLSIFSFIVDFPPLFPFFNFIATSLPPSTRSSLSMAVISIVKFTALNA